MIIIGEWMVEDYLRNVPIRSDVKRSVISFLRGGYLASGGYRFYLSINDARIDNSIDFDVNSVSEMRELLLVFCQENLTQEIVRKYFGTYEEICKSNYNTFEIIMELRNNDLMWR